MLVLLALLGVVVGVLAIVYGLTAVCTKRLRLTHRRTLVDAAAQAAGVCCMATGLGMIVYVVVMVRMFPEGLGH